MLLWHRPAATAPTQPLPWESPGATLKRRKEGRARERKEGGEGRGGGREEGRKGGREGEKENCTRTSGFLFKKTWSSLAAQWAKDLVLSLQ